MKKIILVFILGLLTNFAQHVNVKAQVSGKVLYTSVLESQEFNELEGVLVFNNYKSLFSFRSEKNTENTEGNSVDVVDPSSFEIEFEVGEPLASYHEVFVDRKSNKILTSERYFKDGSEHPCITFEPTGEFDWQITEETKTIGSFKATKATTSFRGRNYTAWFTTEVPVNVGPWKFHGLPGLILEIYDEQKGVQFLVASVQIPSKIEKKITPPTEGKRISIEKYAELKQNFANEFVKLIRAKLPRGAEVSDISVNEVNVSIEREY